MPTIVALGGKIGVVTIGSVALHVTNVEFAISSQILEYAVTGMTADADSNYWMECISGINSASITATVPVDYAATAADRLVGANVALKPGLAGAGTLTVKLAANLSMAAAIIVSELTPTIDVMGNSPTSYKLSAKVNGAVTYANT